ncbi:MAG: hypothetical protein ACK4ND_18635 [Cytophagaceae bacterium]
MNSIFKLTLILALFMTSEVVLAQGPGPKKDKGAKNQAKAQKKATKGNGPPPWAPAHGYRAKTRHIYFQDYDTYYDLQRGVYISLGNGRWEVSARVPSPLKGVNLKLANQIELDLDLDDPQRYYNDHKVKYPKKKK